MVINPKEIDSILISLKVAENQVLFVLLSSDGTNIYIPQHLVVAVFNIRHILIQIIQKLVGIIIPSPIT